MHVVHPAVQEFREMDVIMKRRLFISFVALGGIAMGGSRAQVPAPDFEQIEESGGGLTVPVAWGDFNNDGAPDLAVGNYS